MLLLILVLAAVGKTTANERGTLHPLQPTAVCQNSGPPDSSFIDAVKRALAQYPWNNIFLLGEEQNAYFCLLRRAGGAGGQISYVDFVDGAEHPAFTTLFPETNNFLVVIDISAAQTPQTIHVLLLHEIGHTFGIKDSRDPESVMGYHFLQKEGEETNYFQEVNFLMLTKRDLQKLFLLSASEQEEAVLQALDIAPTTLSQQRKIKCR